MLDHPTIWIVNEAGHNYSKALDLIPSGELKPLTLGDINPLRIDRLTQNLARGIARYVSKSDYMLISGTPVLNAIALTLWLLQHNSCKILQWNAKQREYELSTLNLDNFSRLLDSELI